MIKPFVTSFGHTLPTYDDDLMITTFNGHYADMANMLATIEGVNTDVLLPMYTELMSDYIYRNPAHYHNLEHVVRIIESNKYPSDTFTCLKVYLFAMFHDAVYVVGATDNEKRSADLARKWFAEIDRTPSKSDFKKYVVNPVIKAIELSTYTEDMDLEAQYLLELDLAGLAGPWVDYCANVVKIREEARELVPNDWDFRRRRIAFLEGFLNRRLFWDDNTNLKAKANIWRELEGLRVLNDGC